MLVLVDLLRGQLAGHDLAEDAVRIAHAATTLQPALALLDQTQLRERVERLAAIERGSASSGEARAAELIAAELREAGADVTVEHERAHGTYWWPVGLLTAPRPPWRA